MEAPRLTCGFRLYHFAASLKEGGAAASCRGEPRGSAMAADLIKDNVLSAYLGASAPAEQENDAEPRSSTSSPTSRAQTCVVCNEWSRGRVSAEQKIPKMLKMAKTGCGGQAAVRPKSLKRSIGPEGAAWPKCPKRAAAQRPLAPKRQLGWREAPAAKSS